MKTFLLFFICFVALKGVYSTCDCDVDYEPVGCFKDNYDRNDPKSERPLRELLLTWRDPTSSKFTGTPIDWGNYDDFVAKMICQCAEAAKKEGYTYYGLQYYGECWSDSAGSTRYKMDGASSSCVDMDYQPCPDSYGPCVGQGSANFVYKLI